MGAVLALIKPPFAWQHTFRSQDVLKGPGWFGALLSKKQGVLCVKPG